MGISRPVSAAARRRSVLSAALSQLFSLLRDPLFAMEPPPRAPDQEMTNIFEPAPKRPAPQKAQKAAAKKKPRKQVETHAPTGHEVAKFFTTTTEKLKEAYEKQQKEQEERKEEEEEDPPRNIKYDYPEGRSSSEEEEEEESSEEYREVPCYWCFSRCKMYWDEQCYSICNVCGLKIDSNCTKIK